MKKLSFFILSLCFLSVTGVTFAQQSASVISGQQFGGDNAVSQASIRKLMRSSTGDVFILYAFAQNITTPVFFTPPTTSWSAAVIKYDASLTTIKEQMYFSNKEGTTNVQTVPLDMTLDAQNNVYVVGYATGPSLIWSYDGESTNTTAIPSGTMSGNKMFMVKADQNLQPISSQILSVEAAQMTGIKYTSKGQLAACGYYSSATTADFGNSVLMTKTNTYETGFIVLYNTDMIAQKIIPIPSSYKLYLNRVDADTAGNIYVIGAAYGTIKFGELSGQTIAVGSSSTTQYLFCASYTANGDYRWACTLKGSGIERPEDMTVDKNGNVYLVGHQGTSNNLQWMSSNGYTQPVVFAENPSKTTGSMLMLKLDGQNGKMLWYNMMSSASGTDHLGAVAVDTTGDVYVAGTVNGAANMNPNGTALTINALNLTNQGVIAKYSGLDGKCLFAYATGGSSGRINFKQVYSNFLGRTQLMVAPNKNIFWAGIFDGTVQLQLGGTGSTSYSLAAGRTANYTDMFLLRLAQQKPASYPNKPTLQPAVKNIPYEYRLNYSGLPEGSVYEVIDKLPLGMSLSTDGILTGTLSQTGTQWIRVAVKSAGTTVYADEYQLNVVDIFGNSGQVLPSADSTFRLSLPAQTPANYTITYSINEKTYYKQAVGTSLAIAFSEFPAYNNMLHYKVNYQLPGNSGSYTDSIFIVAFDNKTRAPGGVFGAKLWLRNDIGTKVVFDDLGQQRLMKGSGWLDISGGHKMNLWARKTNEASVYGPKRVVKQLNGEPGYTFVSTDSILVEGNEYNYVQTMFGVADHGETSGASTLLGFYEPYAYDPSANVSNQLKYFFSLGSSKFYTYDAKANMSISAQAGPNLFYTDFKTDRADALLLNGAQRLSEITQNYSLRNKLMYARPVLGARVRTDEQYSTLMNGDVYEAICYPKELSNEERWRVESYLAFKYGLTLYGNTLGSLVSSMRRAYYLSDGFICFDARSTSVAHDHFMYMSALIRDDVSALHKTQSAPYGNGGYNMGAPISDTLSVILKKLVNGSDRNTPQALTNDKDYFIVASESFTKSDRQFEENFCAGGAPKVYSTWKQSWYVSRTPSMNAVCMQFDLSKVSYFGHTIKASKVGMVVMDAAQSTSATQFTFIPATAVDTTTNIAYFDGVNIPSESFLKLVFDYESGLSITNTSIPQGRVRDSYSTTFTASGSGSTEFIYTLAKGTLPEGLTLSSTGLLSGSPIGSAATYPITIRATDQRYFFTEKAFDLVISPDISCPPVVQPRIAVKAGAVGENTRISLNTRELGDYRVTSLLEGSLPKGLQLNAGLLAGIPQEAGQHTIRVQIKDANACSGSVSFDLDIDLPKTLCEKSVSMYPNPASSGVNISISANTTAPVRVQIFNSSSVRVKDISLPAGTRMTRISLAGLTPGQYFVLLSSDGNIVKQLLIVK